MGWRRGNEFRRQRNELSIKCIIWLWYKVNLYMGSAFMLLFLDMVGLKLRINISICIFIRVVGNLESSWVSLQNNLVEYFFLWFVSVILPCWLLTLQTLQNVLHSSRIAFGVSWFVYGACVHESVPRLQAVQNSEGLIHRPSKQLNEGCIFKVAQALVGLEAFTI